MMCRMQVRLINLIAVWSLFTMPIQAQITIEHAYPVDSLLAHTYLTSLELHSEIINATWDEPVMTWDAVNGRFDGTTIAHSFNGVVDLCLSKPNRWENNFINERQQP